jgi:hypothetical protein
MRVVIDRVVGFYRFIVCGLVKHVGTLLTGHSVTGLYPRGLTANPEINCTGFAP